LSIFNVTVFELNEPALLNCTPSEGTFVNARFPILYLVTAPIILPARADAVTMADSTAVELLPLRKLTTLTLYSPAVLISRVLESSPTKGTDSSLTGLKVLSFASFLSQLYWKAPKDSTSGTAVIVAVPSLLRNTTLGILSKLYPSETSSSSLTSIFILEGACTSGIVTTEVERISPLPTFCNETS